MRAFNAGDAADKREPQRTSLPGRATYGLSDVYFRDATNGWATGFNNVAYTSFILRTGGSGGASWKTSDQSAAGNYLFSALAPAPGGRLWAVGDSGYETSLIAVSKDGGRTWIERPSGTKQYLFGVDFPDAAHGWVCGAAGTLLRSVDAGKTWKRVASAPSGDLQAIDFVDAQHGWLVANDQRGPSATLWYTADGGAHWSSEYVTTGRLLYSVDVVGDAVWAAGGDPAGAAGLIVRGALGGPWTTSGPDRNGSPTCTWPTRLTAGRSATAGSSCTPPTAPRGLRRPPARPRTSQPSARSTTSAPGPSATEKRS